MVKAPLRAWILTGSTICVGEHSMGGEVLYAPALSSAEFRDEYLVGRNTPSTHVHTQVALEGPRPRRKLGRTLVRIV